jgi:hypothetical protein
MLSNATNGGHMSRSSQEQALAIAQIATGIGIVIFWLLFFTVGMAPARPPSCYFAYEHSFPPPDTILAIALVASGINSLNDGTWGRGLSLACAGGLLFLGLIDFSFTAQNGGFDGPIAEVLQASIISLWCVGLGLWIIAALGRQYHSAPE